MNKSSKKKTVSRKKKKVIDPIKEAETAKRVAEIQSKRQKIIDQVHSSLQRRRMDKIAIRNAFFEKEARFKQKKIRDDRKVGSEKIMLQIRNDMGKIAESGIKCVYTSVIIPEKIKFDGRQTLSIKGVKYKLKKNLHLFGWGKEAVTMSAAFERIVGKHLKKGFVVVPRKSIFMMWSFPEAFPALDSRISFVEGGTDGQPDEKSVSTTRKILHYAKKLKKRDLLVVMLSQGIDDLLCCPAETISLRDKFRVLQRLKAANATPEEINIVRNKLSAIRGGDLARMAYPARIIILITSDVSGEPMAEIAGGPCVYDPKDEAAFSIVAKYKLMDKLPLSVRELLEESTPWNMTADKQLDANKKYKFVQEYVIACNADAMNCMAVEAVRLGLLPMKLNSTCSGELPEFAREYVKLTSLMILAVEGKVNKLDMYEEMKESPVCALTDEKVNEIFPAKDKWGLGLCLLLGGRPTVNLCSNPGHGGPNQELALYFSLYWNMRARQYPILREYTVWFLGSSSYGKDGNTAAAGAFGYKSLTADVHPKYEDAVLAYNLAQAEMGELLNKTRIDVPTAMDRLEIPKLEAIKNKYAEILPKRVLTENDSYLLFSSVNDEDELLELESGNYYTFTNVGDLHIIRIVRFQCYCNSDCHGNEDKICTDNECTAYSVASPEEKLKRQYCCQVINR